MRRLLTLQSVLSFLMALAIAVSFAGGSASAHHSRPMSSTKHPLCSKIGTSIWASAAVRMWCFPPQPQGSPKATPSSAFGSNVNAASPAEDISPSGLRGYGQSETSVAGVGPYVVEAWNDATAFVTTTCPSPMNKEEVTGYGFSADGGASFVDEGGLPNPNCKTNLLGGDPSMEAWSSGGSAYFYVSSLYFPVFSPS